MIAGIRTTILLEKDSELSSVLHILLFEFCLVVKLHTSTTKSVGVLDLRAAGDEVRFTAFQGISPPRRFLHLIQARAHIFNSKLRSGWGEFAHVFRARQLATRAERERNRQTGQLSILSSRCLTADFKGEVTQLARIFCPHSLRHARMHKHQHKHQFKHTNMHTHKCAIS